MRILISDDHPFIRQGVKQIVTSEFPGTVIGEAETCPQVLERVHNEPWDVVVLDMAMPGGHGLDVLKQIKHSHPQLPVIILTMHTEDQFGTVAIQEGAAGYVTKKAATEELAKAIRKAIEGGKYISPTLAENLAYDIERGKNSAPHKKLSNREYQVFIMLASGQPISEIAIDLSLSEKTVRKFRTSILHKMGMKNAVELAHYAIREGLVS